MRGQQSIETHVGAPASEVWAVYRGLELKRLIHQQLSHVVGKVEVLEGDGGVGTIVKVTFPPETPGYVKEVFRKVDDNNRVKESDVMEGGYTTLGIDICGLRLEIIEKNKETSIIKSTVKFETEDSKAELASSVCIKPFEIMAKTVEKYIIQMKSIPSQGGVQ